MKRRFIGITLLLVFVSLWTIPVADAGNDEHLDVAEQGVSNTKTLADEAMLDALIASFLYSHADSEYVKNQAKIDNGKVVTASSLLALTVQTVISTGPISVTATVSSAINLLGLKSSITKQTSLESAYESAILSLQNKICDLESSRTTYNNTYDTYISMFAGHTGWTSAEVLNTIQSNPGYPAVYHKNSVTTSHVHDGVLRATYRIPSEPRDFICGSYAEYGEGNGCGREFDLPSTARDTHYVLCGDTGDPTATDAVGCNNFYYNCDSKAKEMHKPRDCGSGYWAYTTHGWSMIDCTSKYRNCFATSGRHVSGGGPGFNGLLPHGVGFGSTENPVVSPTPTPTPPSDGTPNCPDCTSHCSSPCSCSTSGTCNGTVSYHACGVHETSVSGDHSLQASCSSTDSNGNYCTVTSFYACDGHTHTYPTVSPPPPPSTPTTVACGGASYTGCLGASSRTEHHVPLCSNGCGNGYWTCSEYAYRHTDEKTCKRSGCSATLTECQNGPNACVRPGKPANWHWL